MALTLSNVQLQELFLRWKQGVQPWSDFLDTKKYSVPKTLKPVGRRVVKNVDRFKSNYTCVTLLITAFSILSSPVMLLVLAFTFGACYIILSRSQDHKVFFAGREVTLHQQFYAVGIISLWLLWLFGIGSLVFWIIGLSFALITSHASFYAVDDEYTPAELQPAVIV